MSETKRIFDPLYGFISITSLMREIIDTPEFQRLRDLKQLGAVYYVYPSATHSRFAHSLGVSHLAGLAAQSLKAAQSELEIDERDIELFRIAGLIHDIGHGPFSHLYDDPEIRGSEPEHEERGCMIFREMVSKYKISLNEEEVECIIAMVNPQGSQIYEWKNQIIANKICQLDVDKLDYIRRDCYHIGLQYGGQYSRLITDMRVGAEHPAFKCKQVSYIAWPEKLQYEIYSVFATRYRLHREVYTHHTVRAYEFIIKKIMLEIKSKNPNFQDLTDSIITCRLHSTIKDYQDMIATRDIPRRQERWKNIKNDYTGKEFYVDRIRIGFASGKVQNPLDNVFYYSNEMNEPKQIKAENNSFMIPKNHQEEVVRVYKLPEKLQ